MNKEMKQTLSMFDNSPPSCHCGGEVDPSAHRSRKEGICTECSAKVSLD